MTAPSPMDILRRTPKSNCGECGYPACLAFAAAVAKTGVNPSLCPYINMEGLEIAPAAASAMEDLSRQRDLEFIKFLQSKIAALDFSSLATPLGADWNPGNPDILHFSYLGQSVALGKRGISLDGAEPQDPRDQILLYNYVHSGGCANPSPEWIGMESMPNSLSKVRTLATYCETPLARDLDGKTPQSLAPIAAALNGRLAPEASATCALVIPVLPALAQTILFWAAEPEDGFDAKVKLLFPGHALQILDIESLLFSAERLAERIHALLAVTD